MCKTKLRHRQKKPPQHNPHLEASESDSESYSLFTLRGNSSDSIQVELTMNSIPVSMELNTRAAVSLINTETYHRIVQASQLKEAVLVIHVVEGKDQI